MSVPITKTTDFLSAVSRTLSRGVCRHYWKRVFPGLRNGCKSPFFSLLLAVFLGLSKETLFVIPRCDSGLTLGLKPCSTIWTMFRESRGALKREYGDSSLETAMD